MYFASNRESNLFLSVRNRQMTSEEIAISTQEPMIFLIPTMPFLYSLCLLVRRSLDTPGTGVREAL